MFSFPLAMNSMPVSYDSSSLLKCTVSLSYVRYVLKNLHQTAAYSQNTPSGSNLGQSFTAAQQAGFNAAGFAGGIVDSVVDNLTGSDFLGDLAGGLAAEFLGSR